LFATLMAISLTLACGGGGGGGTNQPNHPSDPSAPSKVFVADGSHSCLASIINPNPAVGTLALDRIITGPWAHLGSLLSAPENLDGLAYDTGRDLLYVCNRGSIFVFSSAGTATGDVAPARIIQPPDAGKYYSELCLDAQSDTLYAIEQEPYGAQNPVFKVIPSASTASGVVTPAVSFTIHGTNGFTIDRTAGLLYIQTSNGIAVYKNLATLSGSSDFDHSIAFPTNQWPNGGAAVVATDPTRNLLYCVTAGFDLTPAGIWIIPGAATTTTTANGVLVPVPNGQNITRLQVDPANDRLYLPCADKLYILEHASTATAGSPLKVIQGPTGTWLTGVALAL
jgi:hypothetical protein